MCIQALLSRLFINNRKLLIEERKKSRKFHDYFDVMDIWMSLVEENKAISSYFVKNGYKKIAIYGLGKLGVHLYEQLKDSNIKIAYFIDKRAIPFGNHVKIHSIDDELESVDVIVVTPIFDYKNIRQMINSKCNYKVISIEDVVYEMYEEE